ncbi:lysine decarboxylase superfamily protein [Mycobacterium lentiflavum]|uniref:Cytokinin riboside 5'-monophosphate phosphoribohydrolase n=1 Tax=Mycobacterium lentiflavum TaxID=141349 RepID=A0A0E4H0X0_MYCLN|nr:TIGR00730 family Rossman fold protein [Mycobacterium lentiflavum]MEE3067536.1 TIGR00730 family Rossman fold protein [Actinomycetota bacterium]ULP41294.1 TIGR00730 family Rossman fold protein [Mycobacterium lentiflavum]CQD19406.1 lysine decarboxylase superfamily protein [Mycobacterium lentiflavum]
MRPDGESAPEWAVCVYCASGPTHPELLDLASELGEAIADRGWTLVWGGGDISAMGAVASAARARGGKTVGIIPRQLVRRELADENASELIVTDDMRDRKRIMEERSDAFIALPGGIGTLDELFEAWTTGSLGMHDKPVVLLDTWGHYEGLLVWLNDLVDRGYIAQVAMDTLVLVDKVYDAIEACAPV